MAYRALRGYKVYGICAPEEGIEGRLSTGRKSGEKVKNLLPSWPEPIFGDRCASSLSTAALTSFVFDPGAFA